MTTFLLLWSWGELFYLQGKNGSGKSTLIKLINGDIKSQKGNIILNCKPHQIGFLPQNPIRSGDSPYVALDIVRMGDPVFFSKNKALALKWLKVLHLENKKKHLIHKLSGGEVRRVFLANALMGEKKLLILDEPLANLDKNSVFIIETLIKDLLMKKNLGILVTSHDEEPFRNHHKRIVLK